jgi:peptidoglycan/LPS O-acetylase OafA/YrhL
MTAGPAARIPRTRLVTGDGLRAAAALTVLLFHTSETFGRARFHNNLADGLDMVPARVLTSLNAGIFIFFVLSGYLVSRGFVRSIVLGTDAPSVRRYAWSRLLRIVPAFWVAVTVTLVIEGTFHSGFAGVAAIYAFAQLYVVRPVFGPVSHAWTLDVEMAFYIALPIFTIVAARWTRRLADPRHRAAALLAVLAVAGVASAAWLVHANPYAWHTLPPMYFVSFAPGIAAAILEPFVAGDVSERLARVAVPALIAASLALFAAICVAPPAAIGWRAVLGTLSAGSLLGAALMRQWASGRGWRLVDNRIMRWTGERSYGIYLYHILILTQVQQLVFHGSSPWAAFVLFTAVTLAVSVAAAALSWRFIEVPALRLRTRLDRSRPTPHPALAELPA